MSSNVNVVCHVEGDKFAFEFSNQDPGQENINIVELTLKEGKSKGTRKMKGSWKLSVKV